MGTEPLLPQSTSQEDKRKLIRKSFLIFGLVCYLVLCGWILLSAISAIQSEDEAIEKARKEAELYVPDITIQSLKFTVLNVTDQNHLSVNWDILIRIPPDLPGDYMCLNGDFQVLILYKGATIATSSIKSYNVVPYWPRQFIVSMIASEGDMDGATLKDIMEVVKDKGEIRFGTRFILPDCRIGTSGVMEYACDEATLHFGSQRNATLFGNYPNCVFIR